MSFTHAGYTTAICQDNLGPGRLQHLSRRRIRAPVARAAVLARRRPVVRAWMEEFRSRPYHQLRRVPGVQADCQVGLHCADVCPIGCGKAVPLRDEQEAEPEKEAQAENYLSE